MNGLRPRFEAARKCGHSVASAPAQAGGVHVCSFRQEEVSMGTTVGSCASNAAGTFYWKLADGNTLAESDLGGNWTEAYGLIRGNLVSRVDLPANVVHYYFKDHLGSTSIITDASGSIQKE